MALTLDRFTNTGLLHQYRRARRHLLVFVGCRPYLRIRTLTVVITFGTGLPVVGSAISLPFSSFRSLVVIGFMVIAHPGILMALLPCTRLSTKVSSTRASPEYLVFQDLRKGFTLMKEVDRHSQCFLISDRFPPVLDWAFRSMSDRPSRLATMESELGRAVEETQVRNPLTGKDKRHTYTQDRLATCTHLSFVLLPVLRFSFRYRQRMLTRAVPERNGEAVVRVYRSW